MEWKSYLRRRPSTSRSTSQAILQIHEKRNPSTPREDEIFHHLEASDSTKRRPAQTPDGVEKLPSQEPIYQQVDIPGYTTDSTKEGSIDIQRGRNLSSSRSIRWSGYQQVDTPGYTTDSKKRKPSTPRDDEIFRHLEGSDPT